VRRRSLLTLAGVLAAGCAAGGDPLGDVLRGPGRPRGGLTVEKIVRGLKEALRLGAGAAVETAGRRDGYWGSARLRVPMPQELATLERTLRQVGLARQVEEFHLSMNRAAERAAPAARGILVDAITAMTIDDARRILDGADAAATDYFRARTSGPLATAFRPIVADALDEVGVTRLYRDLVARYNRIPLGRPQAVDLERYVTGRALDGLFLLVADEERRIRRDPAARVTELLREVFGRR
jgi:hypothetical protein